MSVLDEFDFVSAPKCASVMSERGEQKWRLAGSLGCVPQECCDGRARLFPLCLFSMLLAVAPLLLLSII